MKQLAPGTQIAYIPTHAKGDIEHPNVEFGFVTSQNDRFYFCRYWSKFDPSGLRTIANSEATPPERIVLHDSRPQEVVNQAMLEIDQGLMTFWKSYGEGDPPAHIQAAFDREQVRRLKGEN